MTFEAPTASPHALQRYSGFKVVGSTPMSRGTYNLFRGWVIPADENPEDEGYLIEDPHGARNTPQFAGYVSWLPKAEFERSFVLMNSEPYSFGDALIALKLGFRMARQGWNGKGMFIYYVPAASYPPTTRVAREFFGGTPVPYGAYLAMKTADGNVVPWLASQTDVLAEDWVGLD